MCIIAQKKNFFAAILLAIMTDKNEYVIFLYNAANDPRLMIL